MLIDAEIIERAEQRLARGSRRGEVQHHLRAALLGQQRRRFDLGVGHLALQQQQVARAERKAFELLGPRRRVGAGGDDDGVFARRIDDDERRSGRLGDGAGRAEVDAVGVEQRQRRAGEGIGPASADQRHFAPARRAASAWFAPLPPGMVT